MYLSSVSSRLLLNDVNTWDLKKSYGCYEGIIRDASWSDDSKYILQVNSTGQVDILSPADHDIKSVLQIPLDTWSACFHRDGFRNIAIGTKSGKVMIWDTKTKSITKTLQTPARRSSIAFLSYNTKNTNLAATMQSGETIIYSLVSNIPILTIKLSGTESIAGMKFHHESRSLLGLATDEGHIILRDVTTNKDKAIFENVHASPVSDFTYSLVNKDVMLSSGLDKIMNVYDIRMQNVVSSTRTSYTLTSIAINVNNQVAIGSRNGHVLLYDLRDLTCPFKILRDHTEEVSKVAFQPARRKTASTELSLREDVDVTSSLKVHSPASGRTSDNMFFVNDTPPKHEVSGVGDNKEDSFLVMLGLDKSNIDNDDDINRSLNFETKSHEMRYRQLDTEKNISKVSTPLTTSRKTDFGFPSPICISNGEDKRGSTCSLSNNIKRSSSNVQITNNIDSKCVDELKDFINLTLSYVADDNRNNFLHIMMALTKQKLYLEKQLNNVNQQMQHLVQNQNDLVEANRQLSLQVEQLKSQHNMF
ncbi:uncharacterized protein LOC121737082 [Aricia agestis]|uniref:uncharacterized protein LOC121737082 n=1 Tax=Aricia agestis TaxID=91739 RepID=UPI001C208B58|nr:uncharacterized protein LOC121737082 [Aricia agestis]